MLSVWHARLAAFVDRNEVKKMARSDAVHDMGINEVCSTKSCSFCVEGIIADTPVRSRTTLKARRGAVLHTKVAQMNVSSVSGAKYLVTFVDEAYGLVTARHVKKKGEDAEFLKQHVR